MALQKDINSYADISEAESYFEDRIDIDVWTSADEGVKSKALVTASSLLDSLNWAGVAVSDSQALAFPRTGTYFDPRVGVVKSLDSVNATLRLKNATFELAYHLLNNEGLLTDTGKVRSLDVGSIALNTIIAPSTIPSAVKRLIRPMLINNGSNAWWRAN